MTDQALNGPSRRITKGADRVTFDLFGHVEQHVDLFRLRIAAHQTVHYAHHPAGSFAAWRTLTAGFVLVELRQTPDRLDHIGGVIHHDDRRRPEARALFAQVVEIHDRVAHLCTGDHRHRRPAGDHSLEVVPAATDTAAMLFDQFFERDAHRFFDDAGVVHVSRDREKLGACVVRTPEA